MFAIVFVAMLCPILAQANNTEVVDVKAKLEALVDEYIACCQSKSALRSSRSENIRRSAIRSCQLASYCKHSKAELVEAMLRNNIEPKAYKVRYFLNGKFKDEYEDLIQAKEVSSK